MPGEPKGIGIFTSISLEVQYVQQLCLFNILRPLYTRSNLNIYYLPTFFANYSLANHPTFI
jgi:hypothetical protein